MAIISAISSVLLKCFHSFLSFPFSLLLYFPLPLTFPFFLPPSLSSCLDWIGGMNNFRGFHLPFWYDESKPHHRSLHYRTRNECMIRDVPTISCICPNYMFRDWKWPWGHRGPGLLLLCCPSAPHSNKGRNDILGPKYQCQLVPYVQETEMFGLPFSKYGGLVTKLC